MLVSDRQRLNWQQFGSRGKILAALHGFPLGPVPPAWLLRDRDGSSIMPLAKSGESECPSWVKFGPAVLAAAKPRLRSGRFELPFAAASAADRLLQHNRSEAEMVASPAPRLLNRRKPTTGSTVRISASGQKQTRNASSEAVRVLQWPCRRRRRNIEINCKTLPGERLLNFSVCSNESLWKSLAQKSMHHLIRFYR